MPERAPNERAPNAVSSLSRSYPWLSGEGFNVHEGEWSEPELAARIVAARHGLAETPEGRLRVYVLSVLGDGLSGWRAGEFLDEGGALFAQGRERPQLPGLLRELILVATSGLCDRVGCSGRAARTAFQVGLPGGERFCGRLCGRCVEELAHRIRRHQRSTAGRTRATLESDPGRARLGRASEVSREGAAAVAAPSASSSLLGSPSKTLSAESSAEPSAETGPPPPPDELVPCPACGVELTDGGLCLECAGCGRPA